MELKGILSHLGKFILIMASKWCGLVDRIKWIQSSASLVVCLWGLS